MRDWVLASGNPGKLRELGTLLGDLGLNLKPQSALGIGEIDETGQSFVENALLKARHAATASGLPALADDSGLVVDALGGAPGLHSARYAGLPADPQRNIDRLLDALAGLPMQRRGAYFVCVLVLLRHPTDPDPLIASGRWPGRILEARQGLGGFGYDPVFLPEGQTRSAAELDPAEKNRISHRAIALAGLRAALPDWLARA